MESIKLQTEVKENNQQQLQTMLDSSPEMIFFKDSQKKYILVNKAFSGTIGIPIKKIIDKTYAELFPDTTGHILEDDSEVLEKGEPVLNRCGCIETSEGRIQVLIDKIPFKDADNNVTGIMGFARENPALKRAEKENKDFQQHTVWAEKTVDADALVAGVAHDLNNSLSGILSIPELLLMQLPKDSSCINPILIMQESGKRAIELVQDLLALVRREGVTKEAVNLNDVVSEYLKSPEHEKLKSHHPLIEVKTDLEANLLNVHGSLFHLSRTVMNLVSNAAETAPEGGKIFVSTGNRNVDMPISGYECVEEGEYVALAVSDTGTGISSEDIKRIFEPFYTKKEMGRSGTGLGMPFVWSTVKDHNGYIDVQTRGGRGTTFTLYFPAARSETAKDKALLTDDDYMGGGESILVVDDEKEQRTLVYNLLAALDYEVEAVSSCEEAIEHVKENTVDLIVLDMSAGGGIDGLETIKRILEIHPGQRTIIISGYPETERIREAQRLGAGVCVKKPYTLEKLGSAVKEELEK